MNARRVPRTGCREPSRRRLTRSGIVAAVALAAGLLAGCGSDGTAGSPTTSTPPTVPSSAPASTPITATNPTDATAYCTDHGGTVETRQAYADTNGDRSVWVALAGRLMLCRFVAEDESRIYVDVDSLVAEQPSLAAAAYLAKLPVADGGGANPAAVNCSKLGGTSSFGGNSASGGGWVDLDDPTFTVVNLCVFADGSAIDEWGIAYYSEGAIRGADLAPLFRFDATTVSTLFPRAQVEATTTTSG